ncbi:helix-turn-helix domain-containing protein [Spirillospora sp. CA-294931]|uniref:helix-turn-helix domain-containing protein n=1 Tax=Spirillospora sp. CA-294931 TaxID=3240042 RepID=UPI003D8A25E5
MSELQPSDAARRVFGVRLRDLRLDAGFKSGRAFAAAVGLHPSKVSRAENGKQHLPDEDLRAWARVCGAEDQIGELIAANRQVEQMWSEHRRELRVGQSTIQARGLALYQLARRVCAYESLHVPGILQTYRYARAQRLVTAILHGLPLADVDEAARHRLKSQVLITEGGGPTFSFVCEAYALYTVLGGDVEMMVEQYDFLIEAASKPHVSLGIIPLGVPRTLYPNEGFYLFDDRQVRQDFWSGALETEQPADIAHFTRVFGVLRQHAVYGAAARQEIEVARSRLQSSATP